jgi:cell surface protein SprA
MGRVPLNPIQVTNSFSKRSCRASLPDVGLDGLNDDSERVKMAPYLSSISSIVSGPALQEAQRDPGEDDFVWYRDPAFTSNDGILKRYKNFNGTQGNTQINTGSEFSSAATLYPDGEDINRDNTMNETEEYFQYIVNVENNRALKCR